MKVSTRYWSPDACHHCDGEDEADELVGGLTYCKANGVCKHLENGDPKAAGLSCVPPLLLYCSGMKRTLSTLEKLSLLDVDGHGLPTLRALGWIDVETTLASDDFTDCLFEWFSAFRSDCAKERMK